MKKLLKSEICGPMNSARVCTVHKKVEHFGSQKKKVTETQMCVWEAQNTLPKRTLILVSVSNLFSSIVFSFCHLLV